jgi:hypothetical protein
METYDNLNNILLNIQSYGSNSFIIVTGGIGDFLTIDYFFSYSISKNIIFISKQSLRLKTLMKSYNLKKNYYALYFDFSLISKPGFDNSLELFNYLPIFKKNKIHIVNICDYFPIIRKKIQITNCINTKSIFFNEHVIKDIKNKFMLPETYAVICPYTEDSMINCISCNFKHKKQNNCKLTRNFIDEDYIHVLEFLKNNNIIGVILSTTMINIIDDYKDYIINLSCKTSLTDSIEIVKQSSFFFGVDSILSVISSKILRRSNIYVKCNNTHGYNFKDIYWYPNKDINLSSIITP